MQIPEFTIDLTLPPEKRFEEMGTAYRRRLGRLLRRVKETVVKNCALLSPLVAAAIPVVIAQGKRTMGTHEYLRELAGFAEAARVPFEDLLLANLVYDFSAGFKIPMFGCTGFVHGGPASPLIARAMDWYQPEGIGKESVVIRFINPRQGWELLTVGFPGINGVISGMSSVGVAVTVNQRTPDEAWVNFPNWATPTLWRVREVLENSTSFASARRMITRRVMASPAFFLLCGTRSGEACLVLSDGTFQSHHDVSEGSAQAISNHVPGGPPLRSDYEDATSMERLQAMSRSAARMKTADIRASKTALARWPVFCGRTVQQMVLSPAEGVLHLRCVALGARYAVFQI